MQGPDALLLRLALADYQVKLLIIGETPAVDPKGIWGEALRPLNELNLFLWSNQK